MAVQLRSDRHPLFGPGFALLVFDRPIDMPRLDISILNTVTGLYLGPSAPGRPNWVKQRTTFFTAIRTGGQGSGIFRVGPEVTTYIQEGTYVEVESADGSVCEEFSWEGVLLRSSPVGTENWASRPEAFEFSPSGSPASDAGQHLTESPDLEKVRRAEQEAFRSRQQGEDRSRAEKVAAAAALARQQAEEDARRRAEEVAAAQRAHEEAIRRRQEEERRRAEKDAAAAAQAQRQAEEDSRIRAEEAAAARRIAEDTRRKRQEEQLRAEKDATAAAQAQQQVEDDAQRIAEETAAQSTNEEQGTAIARVGEGRHTLRGKERGIVALAMLAAIVTIAAGAYDLHQSGYLCSQIDVLCRDPRGDVRKGIDPTPSMNAPRNKNVDMTARTNVPPNATNRNTTPEKEGAESNASERRRIGYVSDYSLTICNRLVEAIEIEVAAALPYVNNNDEDRWIVSGWKTIRQSECEDFDPPRSPKGLAIAYFHASIAGKRPIGPVRNSETVTFCVRQGFLSLYKSERPQERCEQDFERRLDFWKVPLSAGNTKIEIRDQTTIAVVHGRPMAQ